MLQLPYTYTAPLSELAGPVMWVYVLGNRDGSVVKIGHTTKQRVRERLQAVQAGRDERGQLRASRRRPQHQDRSVWLNPPYGENDRWFKRALEMMDAGLTTQLCMLSPVYAFSTGIARPVMARAAAAVLLSPTPQFFNPGDPTKTGTNLPHAIVYWGHRRQQFLRAFAPKYGFPFNLAWDDVGEAA